MNPALAQVLVLQVAVAALTLGFGWLALRVAPGPGTSPRTVAWYLAGVAFTLDGVVGTVHASAAAAAMIVGVGTPFYVGFMRLSPLGNDARNLLVLGFAVGLAWVVLLERPVPSPRVVVGSAAGLVAAGFVGGLAEGPMRQQGAVHFSVLSLLGAVTVVLLFAALYRGMMRETVDWLLWIALVLYAAQQAISSNFQTVLAWAGFGGGWSPPLRGILWAGVVAAGVMLACSVRRLSIARAGGEAPGLLERLRG